MNDPRQLNDERTQESVEDTQIQTTAEVVEIEADVLEHITGGTAGGGGVGDN